MGILGTSLSGLMAAQMSLDTTSHNIANVNTDGYSRQSAEYSTRPAQFTGAVYIGQGVNATTVARSYDQFIANQLTATTSSFSEADGLSTMAAQVDNVVSNNSTGLPVALNAFFNSANEVANNPSSVPVRQVMVSQAGALSQQFNNMSSQLETFRTQTNNQMQANVTDINTFAKSIADLNARIVADESGSNGGQLPNDLLDQRDALLNKMAEKVGISTINQSDGSVSVFIGSGQSLVLGATSATLSLAGSSTDITHKEILINGQDITKSITGGALSGALKFRDTVLDPAQQQLGQVAAGFAIQFNNLQAAPGAAFDLKGNQGTPMFSLGTPTVVAAPGSTGTVTAAYDPANTGNLQPSDYQLVYNGATYSLTQLSNNTVIPLPGTFPGTPAAVGGMIISVPTPPTVGVPSSFLIRPTFDAAKNINTLITDPVLIAAASVPASPGDNSQALKMAGLTNQSLMNGGQSTLNDVYVQLSSQVATLTQSAQVGSKAQQALLNSAKQSQQSQAGVNLDEEAANLIKFQNAYQASAKAISAVNSLFGYLMAVIP